MKLKILFALLVLLAGMPLCAKIYSPPLVELPPDVDQQGRRELEAILHLQYEQALVKCVQIKTISTVPPAESVEPLPDPLPRRAPELLRLAKQYNKIAHSLDEQLSKLPGDFNELMKQYQEYQEKQNAPLFETQKRMLTIYHDLDSTYSARQNEFVRQFDYSEKDYYSLLSISVAGNLFVQNNAPSQMYNRVSPSFRINLHPYKLLGFWRGFEAWYEYTDPKILTKTIIRSYEQEPALTIDEQWNSNVSVLGVSARIQPIINPDKYYFGLKLGLGYFWGSGTIYNLPDGYYSWEGVKGELEFYLGTNNFLYPLELFAGLSLYDSFSKDLTFNTGSASDPTIDAGKTQLGIYLGLRYKAPF